MQSKQPKTFWRLVNGLSKKKIPSEINLNTLYEYFKTVNTTVCDETRDFINTDNDILDVAITEVEILCAVRCLKNGKASGDDEIINEHIKTTIDILLPFYYLFILLCLIRCLIQQLSLIHG